MSALFRRSSESWNLSAFSRPDKKELGFQLALE
jgi:hypothetical protein